MVKTILSWIFAFLISIFLVVLMIKLFGAALDILFNLAFIIIIVIIALPLYMIIKKKFFKKMR